MDNLERINISSRICNLLTVPFSKNVAMTTGDWDARIGDDILSLPSADGKYGVEIQSAVKSTFSGVLKKGLFGTNTCF